MKILAFLIPAVVNAAVAVCLFFLLVLGLNGFSGKQAEPGFLLYIVWAIATTLGAGVLSVVLAAALTGRKDWGAAAAVSVASLVFGIFGAVSSVVGLFAAVFLVSALR